MTASATVDLPQPDSPTRPIASLGITLKERRGMTFASPARMKYEIRTSWNSRIGVSVTQRDLAQAHGEQVEADDERGDRGAGDERHVRPDRHHAVGLLHHAAP